MGPSKMKRNLAFQAKFRKVTSLLGVDSSVAMLTSGPSVRRSVPPDSWMNPSLEPSCFWRAHGTLPVDVSPDLWLKSHQESTGDPLDIWDDFQRKGPMCPTKARWFTGWVHPAIWWGRSPLRWPTCEHGH